MPTVQTAGEGCAHCRPVNNPVPSHLGLRGRRLQVEARATVEAVTHAHTVLAAHLHTELASAQVAAEAVAREAAYLSEARLANREPLLGCIDKGRSRYAQVSVAEGHT